MQAWYGAPLFLSFRHGDDSLHLLWQECFTSRCKTSLKSSERRWTTSSLSQWPKPSISGSLVSRIFWITSSPPWTLSLLDYQSKSPPPFPTCSLASLLVFLGTPQLPTGCWVSKRVLDLLFEAVATALLQTSRDSSWCPSFSFFPFFFLSFFSFSFSLNSKSSLQ